MQRVARFAKLDQYGPWAFLGWVVAVFSMALTVYLFYAGQQKPAIEARVVSGLVLNRTTPVEGLKISFNGTDLDSARKNISLVTVLVRNCGNTTIRQADFDPDHRFGMNITNGVLLDTPEYVEPSSRHFLENPPELDWSVVANRKAADRSLETEYRFSPFLMDAGEFFTVRLLVLHDTRELPQLNFIGKIAGITKVPSSILGDGHEGLSKLFWVSFKLGFVLAFLITVAGVVATIAAGKYIAESRLQKRGEELLAEIQSKLAAQSSAVQQTQKPTDLNSPSEIRERVTLLD